MRGYEGPLTVLVLVGTDYHPFDRLVAWVDEWLLAGSANELVGCLVQFGTSTPPVVASGLPYLDHDDIEALLGRARVVVCHGGPTTIAEARRVGHVPLVLPRSSKLGEHVDDHQIRFVERLEKAGLVQHVRTKEEMHLKLERATRQTSRLPSGQAHDPTLASARFADVVDEILGAGGNYVGRRFFLRSDRNA